MCYFLPTPYTKGEKCPHPVHRVLLCSLLGHLPRPSIFADPGNVLPSGISLVITCRSLAGFERFRLEKENLRIVDVINSSSSKTEARFYLGTVRKDTAGHYSCLYKVKNTWSPRSETLQLKVIREDITETSSPISEVTSGLFPRLSSSSFTHHLDCQFYPGFSVQLSFLAG